MKAGATAIYRFDGSKYYWEESPVPKAIFDEIDGKNGIFVSKPSNYNARDMWIMEKGLTAGDIPADCKPGDILIASTASATYSAAHWKKYVRYTDDSALEEFLEGAYKETVDNLQQQIQSTTEAINKMNSDHILNESEKSYIRTEWEKISGYPNFDKVGTSGSYQTTLDIVAASGYTVGEAVSLVFNGKKLTFNGKSLNFNHRGMDSFRIAFYNLRDYLDEMELYSVGMTEGFDRERLARLFAAYYDAQAILIDNSQKYYASKKADDSATSYKDEMAKKLGYDSYADMESQVKENGSIIMEGGYLNAQLIAAKAITAAMIAVEDLFAQKIEAAQLTLLEGCIVGGLKVTTDGLKIDTSEEGEVSLSEIMGLVAQNAVTFTDEVGKQYVVASVGGCAGTAMTALAGKSAYLHCTYHNDRAIGIEVGADSEGAAVLCRQGMFAGLRPHFRALSYQSYAHTLDFTDNVVTISQGTVNMPNSGMIISGQGTPLGQHIKIIHTSTTKLTVYAAEGISGIGEQSLSTEIYSTAKEILEFVFNGNYWLRLD